MDRVFDKVDLFHGITDEDCWLWMGSPTRAGYGQISVKGRHKYVHRISFELFKGPIIDDLCVLHKCDSPACVNPSHLTLGTHQENIKDRDNKGRNGLLTIPASDVLKIRELYKQTKMTQKDLAIKFNCSRQHIGKLVNNERRGSVCQNKS